MTEKKIERGGGDLSEDLSPDLNPKSEVEEGIEEVAKDLKINIPEGSQPLPVKIIALFTLVGGLSVIGSTFSDIFSPSDISLGNYLLRLFAGFVFLLISYGIIRGELWSVWLYFLLVILGFFISSAILLVVPLIIIAYLYTQRKFFRESFFDIWLRAVFNKTLSLLKILFSVLRIRKK